LPSIDVFIELGNQHLEQENHHVLHVEQENMDMRDLEMD
jgi:hypothetical protein